MVMLLASFCCLFIAAPPVRADDQYDVGMSPVLNVRLARGKLTIQTWDRPQIMISSNQPVEVRQVPPEQVDSRIPKQLQFASQQIQTEHGDVTLPAESFVLPELGAGNHQALVAKGRGPVTITIPRTTAMVIAHVRAGRLSIENYRGLFILHGKSADIELDNVGGTGYVESLRGRVVASNSSFDRLRVRTATGNMLFRNCSSQQIQATSAYGSIVYDDGDFQPGLARFESDHGNVALGVRGGAQIGAHSGSGHVVSNLQDDAFVKGDPGTKQATVGGGGPIVTATSKNGSVSLYTGSMEAHPQVRQELSGSMSLPMQPVSPPRRRNLQAQPPPPA
jgi:Putative adhesin